MTTVLPTADSSSVVSMTLLQSKLMSYIPNGSQYHLSNTIGLFLEELCEQMWDDMDDGISAFISDPLTDPTGDLYPCLRVVVILADGIVAYDSCATNNTFTAFTTKSIINENHKPALMINAGTGFEVCYTSRMGGASALGIVRVSVGGMVCWRT